MLLISQELKTKKWFIKLWACYQYAYTLYSIISCSGTFTLRKSLNFGKEIDFRVIFIINVSQTKQIIFAFCYYFVVSCFFSLSVFSKTRLYCMYNLIQIEKKKTKNQNNKNMSSYRSKPIVWINKKHVFLYIYE